MGMQSVPEQNVRYNEVSMHISEFRNIAGSAVYGVPYSTCSYRSENFAVKTISQLRPTVKI